MGPAFSQILFLANGQILAFLTSFILRGGEQCFEKIHIFPLNLLWGDFIFIQTCLKLCKSKTTYPI